ncbi:MAG: oxygen-independent coproporphyrinogen III oxidase [Caulobacteraceae bacterium]|nr:oxygen-independent coproporphyrinogen III oxidase [Caulobacteraceae bacterium]
MNVLNPAAALRLRQLALLPHYDTRAPRYTSYPTAVQFTPHIGPQQQGEWLEALALDAPVSIYAHIPFCARLCWYCGCNTRVVHRGESIRDYVVLLRDEIGMVARRLPGRARVGSIHLGGGTPNMLTPDDLSVLFGTLREDFDVEDAAEIAAELDPAQLTAEWARAAAGHGLNRASLGVQDLSPAVQAAVNRHEPFEVVAGAAAMLRAAGVSALNFDLMYGLPRQTIADVLNTLDQVLTLKPSRIALFGYAHVPWMKSHQKLLDEAELPDGAERLEQSQIAAERLASEGYVEVGIDHFARPDDSMAVALKARTLHRNFQGYTTDQAGALLGFGASAISRLPQGLVQNQPSELLWRAAISEGRLATARGVELTDEDRFRGEVIERLMCDLEVDLDAVAARHHRRAGELAGAVAGLAPLEADGVVERHGQMVRITELGRPFVRTACAQFDAYLDSAALRHSRVV